MHRITKLSLDRVMARRNSAQWREHLVEKSPDPNKSAAPLVWSRLWLRRPLLDNGRDHSHNEDY